MVSIDPRIEVAWDLLGFTLPLVYQHIVRVHIR